MVTLKKKWKKFKGNNYLTTNFIATKNTTLIPLELHLLCDDTAFILYTQYL